jgi:competence protein ComEC
MGSPVCPSDPPIWPAPGVYFLNVGQGDSTLVVGSDGRTMLVDGGPRNGQARAALSQLGVSQLDAVLVTHPDADHIGGLVQILDDVSIPVCVVYWNGQPGTSDTYEDFRNTLDERSIPLVLALAVPNAQTPELTIGELQVDILWPFRTSESGTNDNSEVLRFELGGTTYLLMGDACGAAERSLLSSGVTLATDVLKVAHHGSCSSCNSAAFLGKVDPDVAVISVGADSHGHPCPSTLDSLTALGAVILRTDVLMGTIAPEAIVVAIRRPSDLPAQAGSAGSAGQPQHRADGHVVINEVEMNPAGADKGNEWVELWNAGPATVSLTGWHLHTTVSGGAWVPLPSGITLDPDEGFVFHLSGLALENASGRVISLRDAVGSVIDETSNALLRDEANDGRTWQRVPNAQDTDSEADWLFREETGGDSNG